MTFLIFCQKIIPWLIFGQLMCEKVTVEILVKFLGYTKICSLWRKEKLDCHQSDAFLIVKGKLATLPVLCVPLGIGRVQLSSSKILLHWYRGKAVIGWTKCWRQAKCAILNLPKVRLRGWCKGYENSTNECISFRLSCVVVGRHVRDSDW